MFDKTAALMLGTAALLLSLLTWEVFRESPLGRGIFILSFLMSAFILYHATLVVLDGVPIGIAAVESLLYTGFAVIVWWMVWIHPGGVAE